MAEREVMKEMKEMFDQATDEVIDEKYESFMEMFGDDPEKVGGVPDQDEACCQFIKEEKATKNDAALKVLESLINVEGADFSEIYEKMLILKKVYDSSFKRDADVKRDAELEANAVAAEQGIMVRLPKCTSCGLNDNFLFNCDCCKFLRYSCRNCSDWKKTDYKFHQPIKSAYVPA